MKCKSDYIKEKNKKNRNMNNNYFITISIKNDFNPSLPPPKFTMLICY